MERIKKTIGKILVIVALALAMLLCGVMLGCGEVINDGAGDRDASLNTTETEKNPDEEIGEKPGVDEEYDPDKVIAIPPGVPSTGAHLSIGIDETDVNSLDDITIDVLYGIDVKTFNGYRGSFKNGNEEYTTSKICVLAYDMSIYSNTLHSVEDDNSLYDGLIELDIGEAYNGVFLIDEIPFTAQTLASGKEPEDVYQCLNVKSLIGTSYECKVEYTQMYDEIVYNKKNNIKLPRELFAKDNGNILFGIVLLRESNEDNAFVYEISSYEFRAQAEYTKNGELISFSNVRSGERYRVNDSVIEFYRNVVR